MNKTALPNLLDSSVDPLVRYYACKAMSRGYAEGRKNHKSRLSHARSYCALVIHAYWQTLCERHNTSLACKPVPANIPLSNIAVDAQQLATNIGQLIADFPPEDTGYLIGSIYTVMLPAAMRSETGAYYTPPPLVERLLDLAEDAGFDFTHGSAIDPACGGGAFLAPVALRMWKKSPNTSPAWFLRKLEKRLKGIEIDPFAAWMTLTLLEAALMPLIVETKYRLSNNLILIGDALMPREIGKFDLVIGNPPYGRVALSESLRDYYSRSLYGHANLYGLFTDLAIRLSRKAGVIAYLTPTSFLGGKYYKALRQLLSEETTPLAFDFVSDREGVFDDVLQETLLTAYTKQQVKRDAKISLIIPKGLNAAVIEKIGDFNITQVSFPWMLPRSPSETVFLKTISKMSTRLSDLGYVVSTGPLVWNRHKSQLRTKMSKSTYPLIWAEAVTSKGFFNVSNRRGHVPFIEVKENQLHLVTRNTCVLVQRTTSKEQNRRILAASILQDFIDKNGGVVIENHLNMIFSPMLAVAKVSVATVEALLNTEAVDRAFRCISGSVAVSAYELNALPLPDLNQLIELDQLIKLGLTKIQIEQKVSAYYGVFN